MPENHATPQSRNRATAPRGRWRAGAAAATVAALALLTTACEGGDSAGASTSPRADHGDRGSTPGTDRSSSPPSDTGTEAPSDPSAAPSEGAPSSSAPATGGTGQRGAGSRCTTSQLTMKLGRGQPGAGQVYYDLTFTNTGSRSCTLSGFPGVSLIRRDGSTVGHPATREGAAAGPVTLAPGARAQAALHTTNEGIGQGGCWHRPDLVKVYPPGSKQSMTLRSGTPRVCGDSFTVSSVRTPQAH
ncbi:DUF4232 domain-containing protein [Streptomyces sp. NPDC058045]|uniref:DUF4232 domain-containing protein n=1 Tax=Streptomyces sp. NPDC058045 TaxID=3346311 RepID=UPI0036E1E544